MSESNVITRVKAMSVPRFKQVCQQIVNGLGFVHTSEVPLLEIPVVFAETIERRSTDGMFRTKESWLLAFIRSSAQPLVLVKGLEGAVQAAEITEARNVLVIVFGSVDLKYAEKYHADAKRIGLGSVLLTDSFAQTLLQDYAADEAGSIRSGSFSFAKLRQRMKQQAQDAAWRGQFLSLAALPISASKVYRKEAERELKETKSHQDVLDEADLFGAIYKSSSFLLLGDPGAGKTTCLKELAEELASVGARTPVFLPLNRYDGHLLRNLGEVLCEETDVLSEQEMKSLLSSGALTIILDGLNEVQSQTLQPELVREINELTNPETPMARSQWIVSSRRYDYTYAPQLINLDRHTWELLPLDSSLIYQFLIKELGKTKGDEAYFSLGRSMREVCSNPLLLNMLLSVYKERGEISKTRGVLYRQFVDLLLQKGAELPKYQKELTDLSTLLGSNLTIDRYCLLAHSVLSDLAREMQEKGTLVIGSNEALDIFKQHDNPLIPGLLSKQAATVLYQGLLHRGLLKFTSGKIVFFHHTFQEYFYAVKLKEQPLDRLISHRGIQGAMREAIVFMASTLDSADAVQNLIEHVLNSGDDVDLAYEIMRSTSISISETIQLKIAQSLWNRVSSGGTYIGAHLRSAQMLLDMAVFLDRPVEQLLRDILHPQNEKDFTTHLLRLYHEIGDVKAQRRLMKDIDPQEDIPDDLLFRAAITANNSGDRQKALELYTQYIEKRPDEGVAYGNRALVYKAMGNREKAEEDYKRAINMSQNPVIRTNYATTLIADGRKEQALEELKAAAKSNQNYYATHLELGKLLEAEDLPQALFIWKRPLALPLIPMNKLPVLRNCLMYRYNLAILRER